MPQAGGRCSATMLRCRRMRSSRPATTTSPSNQLRACFSTVTVSCSVTCSSSNQIFPAGEFCCACFVASKIGAWFVAAASSAALVESNSLSLKCWIVCARSRNQELKGDVTIAGADPVNLIGILIPGERTHAVPGRVFVIKSNMLEQPFSSGFARNQATSIP